MIEFTLICKKNGYQGIQFIHRDFLKQSKHIDGFLGQLSQYIIRGFEKSLAFLFMQGHQILITGQPYHYLVFRIELLSFFYDFDLPIIHESLPWVVITAFLTTPIHDIMNITFF